MLSIRIVGKLCLVLRHVKLVASREMLRDQKFVLSHGIMMSLQQMHYLSMALSIIRQKTIPLLTLRSQVKVYKKFCICIGTVIRFVHLDAGSSYAGGQWAAGDEPVYYVVSPQDVVIAKPRLV